MQSEHDAFGLDLPPLDERFEKLEEALAYISTVFKGGGQAIGKHYSFDHDSVSPTASAGLHIVVGGSGARKTPRLAGTFADEYNMFVTDRESFERRLEVMHDAAVEAGRKPEDILISFAGPAFVHRTEEEHQEVLARRGAKRDMSATEYAAFLDSKLVPHGTAEQASSAITAMASWGVGRFYVQDLSPLDEVNLEYLSMVFGTLQNG